MQTILGVRLPDSPLALAASALMESAADEHIRNHSLRAFVLGSLALQRAGSRYDEELAYVACCGHDLGLTAAHANDAVRFEIAGADAIAALMRDKGADDRQARLVWEAVALHATPGLPERFSAEASLVHIGAGMDVAALGLDALSARDIAELVDVLPRDGFIAAFRQRVVERALANPTAHLFSWAGDLARVDSSCWPCPTAAQMLATTAWDVATHAR